MVTPNTLGARFPKVIAAIEATNKAQDKMHAVAQRGGGYHPWGVFASLENPEQFDLWFAKLPDDLTDANLEPLYLLASPEQRGALEKRENAWQPDPANLGAEYNGPLGAYREPSHSNVRKWEKAVEKKARDHAERFQREMNQMQGCDVPERLKDAALNLAGLALDIEHQMAEDCRDEFDSCADACDIVAIDAAIRLCLNALCELEVRARQSAETSLELFRENVADIEAIQGVKR
ncbi:hypothetical protein EON83_17195 [bacterium]|nr:MAG: hypothetical protein EON83_17195 [bacterium]